MALTVVSLFSGCGGLDLGFLTRDTQLIYACDNDPAAVKCFNRNFGHKATQRNVQEPEFLRDLHEIGSADIVLGGFPCQGFSKSGPKKESDPRNQLYASMVEAVRILQPKVFVAENVDGMAQNYKGQFVTQIINDFSQLGYEVEPRILNAVDFGVPQYRRRIIFIGIRKELNHLSFNWPMPTHQSTARNGEFKSKMLHSGQPTLFNQSNNILRHPVTIKEAIGDLLEVSDDIPDHNFIAPR
jgi:DNA (cytosine-5)-methyltransferase 1